MNSARVGSLGSWSCSVSRARHASTNSRTPGQPPASLASSKSRSQRRALSTRLNVSRPARSSPSSSGFQRKRTTCGGPGSPPSVRVECSEAISLGTPTDGKLPTYSGLQIAVAHAALRSSSDKRGGALLRSCPADGLTGRLELRPSGLPAHRLARPGGAARGCLGGLLRRRARRARPAQEFGPPDHDPPARDTLHHRELPGRIRAPQRLDRRPGIRALGGRIAEEGGAGLIESKQRVIDGSSRPEDVTH